MRDHGMETINREAIIAWAGEELAALEARAREVIQDHWGRVAMREAELGSEKSPGKQSAARLTARARLRGTTLEIEWYVVGPRRGEKMTRGVKLRNDQLIFRGIAKGLGNKYRDASLRGKARDYEWDIVRDTERALADIRKAAKLINKVRRVYMEYDKALGGGAWRGGL